MESSRFSRGSSRFSRDASPFSRRANKPVNEVNMSFDIWVGCFTGSRFTDRFLFLFSVGGCGGNPLYTYLRVGETLVPRSLMDKATRDLATRTTKWLLSLRGEPHLLTTRLPLSLRFLVSKYLSSPSLVLESYFYISQSPLGRRKFKKTWRSGQGTPLAQKVTMPKQSKILETRVFRTRS